MPPPLSASMACSPGSTRYGTGISPPRVGRGAGTLTLDRAGGNVGHREAGRARLHLRGLLGRSRGPEDHGRLGGDPPAAPAHGGRGAAKPPAPRPGPLPPPPPPPHPHTHPPPHS